MRPKRRSAKTGWLEERAKRREVRDFWRQRANPLDRAVKRIAEQHESISPSELRWLGRCKGLTELEMDYWIRENGSMYARVVVFDAVPLTATASDQTGDASLAPGDVEGGAAALEGEWVLNVTNWLLGEKKTLRVFRPVIDEMRREICDAGDDRGAAWRARVRGYVSVALAGGLLARVIRELVELYVEFRRFKG